MLMLTTKEMRKAEKLAIESGITAEDLMENTGFALYEWIINNYNLEGRRVVILSGKGNNGGDGYVLARLLDNEKKAEKIVVVMCDGVVQSPTAKLCCNKMINKSRNVDIINLSQNFETLVDDLAKLKENDIIVDAVYGIGFTGELPPLVFSVFAIANKSLANRISIDIPSGICCDSGKIALNTFRADITLAIASHKPAHLMGSCAIYCKRIEVVDMGISESILKKASIGTIADVGKIVNVEMVQSMLSPRDSRTHKGMYGKLLNIAGSNNNVGPAMISTLSAMRIGSGFTNLATTKDVAKMVAPQLMEATTTPLPQTDTGTISAESISIIDGLLKKSSACLIGCGLGRDDSSIEIVEHVIKNANCHLVVDSDALNIISKNVDILKSAKKQIIITPHIGQMAKLVKRPLSDTINNFTQIALDFAIEYGVIVVIKSDNTHIVTPSEKVYRNQTGNAGLAKTGSGDMLAGIIAGLITQGIAPENSAVCATFINGATAEWLSETHSTYSMLTRELIDTIPYVLKDMSL